VQQSQVIINICRIPVSNLTSFLIVANNCALVGIFDHMPDSAQFVIEATRCNKTCLTVIDEAHQILQEKWRRVINRAWEFGSRLKHRNVVCPWLLLSGTLRPEEDQSLAEALAIQKIHTVIRGSARTDNLIVEVGAVSCNACVENLTQKSCRLYKQAHFRMPSTKSKA
jgi:superfamily II DNA helicase RecQ